MYKVNAMKFPMSVFTISLPFCKLERRLLLFISPIAVAFEISRHVAVNIC